MVVGSPRDKSFTEELSEWLDNSTIPSIDEQKSTTTSCEWLKQRAKQKFHCFSVDISAVSSGTSNVSRGLA